MGFFGRIWALRNRSKLDHGIEDEIRTHLEMRIDDNIAAGMSREAAVCDARLRFGNPTVVKERGSVEDAALGLDSTFRDARYAMRGFLSPW